MPSKTRAKNPKKQKIPANLLLALGSLLFFLAIAEGALFLAGVKPLALTDDPYVGFAAGQPLFVKVTGADGVPRYETNPVKLSHFNFQSFPAKKAPGTYRIFTLGGSTTYGHPWRDSTSFTGWLREMLATADTTRRFEVINCGGISYASYRAALLAEELTAYGPDLFIVYNGHNEFLEERTYRAARRGPQWVKDVSSWLDHTRTYSALRRAIRGLESQAARDRAAAAGNNGKLAAEVDDVLARTVGPTSYVRDDSLRHDVLEHYAASERRVALLAHSAHARVIYLSTPSNEKDCAPFKSEPTPGLSPADLQKAGSLLARGEKLLAANAPQAWSVLDSAAALDPRNAEAQYQAGRAALASKRYGEAKVLFRRAIDEDICPLRALTPMRDIEKRVALETGESYLDFVDTLERKTLGEQGNNILGEPDFVDHVHMEIADYGLMARGLFAELARMGVVHPSADFADAGMKRVSARVFARLTPSEEGLGYHNIAKVLNWAGKSEDAARAAKRGLDKDTTSLESIWSSLIYAAQLERDGRSREALPHYRRALRLDSSNSETWRLLGEAQLRTGDTVAAWKSLLGALSHGTSDPAVPAALGRIAFNRGRYAEAVAYLRAAVPADSGDVELRIMLAQAWLTSGNEGNALAELNSLLQRRPDAAEAWVGLAFIAEHHGRTQEAIQDYARASQLDPKLVTAREAITRLVGR